MRSPLTLIVCLCAACGGGGGGGGPTGLNGGNNSSGNPAPNAATIRMQTATDGYGYDGASSFDPTTVTIARGGTITWTNSSSNTHNVTFDTGGAPSNVPDLLTGSASRTFNTSGTFNYHCTNHSGMSGSIIVR